MNPKDTRANNEGHQINTSTKLKVWIFDRGEDEQCVYLSMEHPLTITRIV